MKITTLIILFAFLLIHSARADNPIYIHSSDLENVTESIWGNTSTVVSGSGYSGNKFSHTDSIQQFSFGYKSVFPEVCRNKNLIVQFSEQIRLNSSANEFGMVATVSHGDSVIFWQFFKKSFSEEGHWNRTEDKISIPATMTGESYLLNIYLWNNDKQASIDLDDIKIEFYEMTLPSFLPDPNERSVKPGRFDEKIDLKNIVLWLNKREGGIIIEDKSEDTLFTSIELVTEVVKNKPVTQWQNKWLPIQDSSLLSKGIIKLAADGEFCSSLLSIDAGTTGRIKFSLSSVFKKPALIIRHALVGGYSCVLKNVYKNSLTFNNNFSKEYWLGKEGFSLANGAGELLIYRPATVSSLQLNVEAKQFIVNADYCGDHPMLHFPILEKSYGRFIDRSTSDYKPGDTLSCEFTVNVTDAPVIVPTLLQSSFGNTSTFVWTEHADYTNMRTNRAVYFGSEKILRYDSAVGGFIKYSIPVTKSVFYSNPVPVNNSDKSGYMEGPEATVMETENFRNFLKQLDESGHEICLHTPDHFSCDRRLLDESLSHMRREFSTVTWIDHGYDNSEKSNREDLNCDGTNPESKYYAADLWNKYGIKYLWNSFYEDSAVFAPYSYNSFFTVPYSGWSDPMPVPVYWRHHTRTGELIHWRTTGTLDPPDGSLWSYIFNDMRLNDAVNSRATVIIHCYPARVDSTTGYYDINNDILTANEGFNEALRQLSRYRSEGKIRLSTIKEMLEYRTSLEDISYEYAGGGIVRVENKNPTAIRGVTFSANASEVKANKSIKQKKVNGELIFWLDIQAGEVIDLLLK